MNNRLQVEVGGINGNDIKNGMSGGWEYSFTTTESGSIKVFFDYTLFITSAYESNEYGEAVVELDGVEVVVKRLTGGYGTHSIAKTGEIVAFPGVAAGSHKVTVGVYNNQKTTHDEYTKVSFDNVKVTLEEEV